MFDFTNKSNTKVRHINVTEARANFATILSDTTSHYIITKNSKPQRVIINFEDFEKLQGVEKRTEEGSSGETKTLEADKAKKTKPTKSIKGIIAQQFELSQHQTDEPALEDENFSIDKIKPLSPEEKKPRPEAMGIEALSFDALEELLPDSGAIIVDEAVLADEGDYFQNADEPAERSPEAAEPTPRTAEEILPTVAEQPVCTGESAARTPEEEEYFRRYRKLYENNNLITVPDVSWNTLPDPGLPRQHLAEDPGTAEEVLRQQEDAYQQMRSELGAVTNKIEADELVIEPTPTSAAEFRGWNDSFAMSSGAIAPPQTSNEAPYASWGADAEAGGAGLPSLQELLKELDKERLSGEEGEPLDNRDIDELISRITSD